VPDKLVPYMQEIYECTHKCTRDGRGNRDRPDLSNPATLNQSLETRVEQLNAACQLERWQEAFRSIEDIHGLWALKAHKTKKELRAQYFSCLTQIFSKSGSHCYHAYSWYQLYLLSKKGLDLKDSDQQHLASAVLLSTLAIEPYDRRGPVRFCFLFTITCPKNVQQLLSLLPPNISTTHIPGTSSTPLLKNSLLGLVCCLFLFLCLKRK
jgi:hypothetical protein